MFGKGRIDRHEENLYFPTRTHLFTQVEYSMDRMVVLVLDQNGGEKDRRIFLFMSTLNTRGVL